jgi:hypothetical protein
MEQEFDGLVRRAALERGLEIVAFEWVCRLGEQPASDTPTETDAEWRAVLAERGRVVEHSPLLRSRRRLTERSQIPQQPVLH